MIAPSGREARCWEPKRLQLLSIPARLAASGRRTVLHLHRPAPWAGLLQHAIDRLRLAQA